MEFYHRGATKLNAEHASTILEVPPINREETYQRPSTISPARIYQDPQSNAEVFP